MKTIKLALLAALLLTVFTSSLLAGGFALSGIGSRAISMGGAFRGMADDPSAMYWNPAGLGFMEKSCINVAGAGIMPNSEFTNTATLPGFTNDSEKAEKKTWLFPNIYGVKAGASKLHYGLGVYVPYGLGATWDAYELPATMMTASGLQNLTWSSGFPKNEMESSIGVVDVHPTVSYKVMDNLSLGAGLSVMYGMITIAKIKPHSVYSYYLPTTFDLEGTGMGFGANLGALYKLNDKVQIGLSGKIPSSIKIEGTAEIKTWLSDVINYGLHGNNPAYFVPAVMASKPDAKATMNLPGDIGLGLSMKAFPNMMVNMDFAYTMWSTLDKVTIELDSLNTPGTPMSETVLNTNWKDTYRASIGGEYNMMPMAFRLGFFFDQSPIPNESLSPTWPDTADKYSFNAGYSYNLANWGLDVNFEHIMFADRKITTATEDNMVGEYKTAVNALNLGITYNF